MANTLISLVIGGSLGAIARWGLQRWVDGRFSSGAPFPWGVFVVNVLGCFAFGWLMSKLEGRTWASDPVRVAIFTGFLGSFTTFSTFGWETLALMREGQSLLALAHVAASVMLGLLAVWAGLVLGRW